MKREDFNKNNEIYYGDQEIAEKVRNIRDKNGNELYPSYEDFEKGNVLLEDNDES